jgi:hypothetical protein
VQLRFVGGLNRPRRGAACTDRGNPYRADGSCYFAASRKPVAHPSQRTRQGDVGKRFADWRPSALPRTGRCRRGLICVGRPRAGPGPRSPILTDRAGSVDLVDNVDVALIEEWLSAVQMVTEHSEEFRSQLLRAVSQWAAIEDSELRNQGLREMDQILADVRGLVQAMLV